MTSFCLRYVFESENKLVAGDHINWSKPLDRGTSALRHLLVAKVIYFSRISRLNLMDFVKILSLLIPHCTGPSTGAVQHRSWHGQVPSADWGFRGGIEVCTKVPLIKGRGSNEP